MSSTRLRVLHISEAFGGGVRSAIVHYVLGTPQYDHAVLARFRAGHETLDLPEGIPVQQADGAMQGFFQAARAAVIDGDYDIVHLHSSYAGALRAILPRRTRIVYTPHCYVMEAEHSLAKSSVYWAVEKFLARRAQILVAVAPHEAEIGRSLRRSMSSAVVKNIVLPTGPESTVEGPCESTGDPRPVISTIGRVMAQKDPAFFAKVAQQLGAEGYRFRWIGEGEADSTALLEAAGVEVTGWVPPAAVRSLVRNSDLYLHTAAWEGGPLSTLEAAVVGTPVLARTIPSMQTLGYALAGSTVNDVAASVLRYFSDPDFESEVILATKRLAQDSTIEKLTENLTAAYESAMSELFPARDESLRTALLVAHA